LYRKKKKKEKRKNVEAIKKVELDKEQKGRCTKFEGSSKDHSLNCNASTLKQDWAFWMREWSKKEKRRKGEKNVENNSERNIELMALAMGRRKQHWISNTVTIHIKVLVLILKPTYIVNAYVINLVHPFMSCLIKFY